MSDNVYTRQQYWGTYQPKEAEVGGMMPLSAPIGLGPDKGAKSVIPKTGSALEEFLSKEAMAFVNRVTGEAGKALGEGVIKGGLKEIGDTVLAHKGKLLAGTAAAAVGKGQYDKMRDKRVARNTVEMLRKENSVKEASVGHLVNSPGKDIPPDVIDPVTGEQAGQNPSAKPLSPRVDVSGKEPPKIIQEKTAQHFAMPSIQRYPLDSYTEVKQASSYFETYRSQFAPAHRREFCEHLVKRAGVLGITVSDEVQKYGGEGYAPYAELEIAFGSRALLVDDDHRILLSKLAESRPSVDPETFAVALEEFDKLAGLDQLYDSELMDPYLSVFGKTAGDIDPDGSHIIGNDYVSNQQLKDLTGARHLELLTKTFGADFMKEFVKDPVGMFNSLPADQKKVIARCANEPAADEA